MKRSILILISASLLSAQSAPEFEVATVKPNKSAEGNRGGCHGIDSAYGPVQAANAPPLGRCVVTAARLSHLIGIAYQLNTMVQIKGGPDWVMRGFDRWDIQGKAEDAQKSTEEQLLTMLQSLLVERFGLKFHRETVEQPGFALVVGKNGPRLTPSKGKETTISSGEHKPMPGEPIALTAQKYTMAQLAKLLSQMQTGGQVVDRTGLDSAFDFTLSWHENQGPMLATAVQEQLGLKLEPAKVPVSLFVINSAQKPSAN